MTMSTLKVLKRDGQYESMSYDKITQRIELLTQQHPKLSEEINPSLVAQKVIQGIHDKISTTEIDTLAGEIANSMSIKDPDYGVLASRIVISNLHKNTPDSFFESMQLAYNNISPRVDKPAPQISEELLNLSYKYREIIEETIDIERDFNYSYFGLKTLIRAYLKKAFLDGKEVIVERPQYMLMRVVLGIWKHNIEMALEVYESMSNMEFTHATPTLFNAGTNQPQLSSCFLIANEDDSLGGITNTFTESAKISAKAGGIGLSVHNIRAKGSYIRGSGGTSNGLMPYLRNMNEWSRYWDQCFYPNTLVLSDSGWKEISKITTNDKVRVSDGSYQKVKLNKQTSYKGDVYEINGVKVTGIHPILVIEKQDHLTDDEIKNCITKKQITPVWKSASELVETDIIISIE